jgi:hypothetical protein
MRDLGGVEALRVLSEESSYRGHLFLGFEIVVFEALRMQESAHFDAVIQHWLVNRRSDPIPEADAAPLQDEELWQVFEPADLTDVGFEPTGPRLNVVEISTRARYLQTPTCSNCSGSSETDDKCGHSTCNICLERLDLNTTNAVMNPMTVRCGHAHSFHFECLDNLINSISDFSNLCPSCRAPICAGRARRALVTANVVNDRVDAALAAEDSSEEELETETMSDV